MFDSGQKISVVIPLFQKRDYILRALASVSRQTCRAAEIVIVDDGSTDGGCELVEAQQLPNVRIFKQPNAGAAAARNRAISLAENRYIAFLDADDTWEENHLAELSAMINSAPDAVIFGTSWTEYSKPVVDAFLPANIARIDLSIYLVRSAANHPPFWTSATAVDKNALESNQLFEVGSRIAEDQDAWITMLQKGCGVKSPKVTAHYNIDEKNPTIAKPSAADFASVIFEKWVRLLPYHGDEFREFVSVHQLYTIERHVRATPPATLWRRALQVRTKKHLLRKSRLLVRIALASLLRLTDSGARVN
jgi:glycosyltransferase involved in cell wall biosynthesis